MKEHPSGLCTKCRADGWATGVWDKKRPWDAATTRRYNNWKRWIAKKRVFCKKNHRGKFDKKAVLKVSSHIRGVVVQMARENEQSVDDIMLRLLRADDIDNFFLKREIAAVAPTGRGVGKGPGKKIYPWKRPL